MRLASPRQTLAESGAACEVCWSISVVTVSAWESVEEHDLPNCVARREAVEAFVEVC